MATEVNLPELGESVTEGTVTRWLKQIGDEVAVDEPLLEVSTDKVDTEIPSPVAGTLLEIKANEDDTVEVGAVLAVVGSSDESTGGGDAGGDGAGAGRRQPAAEQPEEQPRRWRPRSRPPRRRSTRSRSSARRHTPRRSRPIRRTSRRSSRRPSRMTRLRARRSRRRRQGLRSRPASGPSVRLPELGESVTEGTVTRWLKQVGDQVAADESLLEVSTDKVDTEIPSPAAGHAAGDQGQRGRDRRGRRRAGRDRLG